MFRRDTMKKIIAMSAIFAIFFAMVATFFYPLALVWGLGMTIGFYCGHSYILPAMFFFGGGGALLCIYFDSRKESVVFAPIKLVWQRGERLADSLYDWAK